MMTILEFIQHVSSNNKILQKLREETASKIRPRDPIVQQQLDDLKAIDDADTEEIGDIITGYPPKPIRPS